jgi:hypothetical protein
MEMFGGGAFARGYTRHRRAVGDRSTRHFLSHARLPNVVSPFAQYAWPSFFFSGRATRKAMHRRHVERHAVRPQDDLPAERWT